MSKGEALSHHKEQHEQLAYYKEIGDKILTFDRVVIFGPTNAKMELYNLLKADHHFDKIEIKVKKADKMTQQEQHLYIRNYFTKQ